MPSLMVQASWVCGNVCGQRSVTWSQRQDLADLAGSPRQDSRPYRGQKVACADVVPFTFITLNIMREIHASSRILRELRTSQGNFCGKSAAVYLYNSDLVGEIAVLYERQPPLAYLRAKLAPWQELFG